VRVREHRSTRPAKRCPRPLFPPTKNSHCYHGRELGKLTARARLNRAGRPQPFTCARSCAWKSSFLLRKFPEPERGNSPTRMTPRARQDVVIAALFFLSTPPWSSPSYSSSPATYP
jgi:hypothetical protein